MKIATVPPNLQNLPTKYPPHNRDTGIENAFGTYVAMGEATGGIDTRAIYLPILWTGNYQAQARGLGTTQLRAVPEAEAYLKTLDPAEQYFTIVQGADRIYEELPPNVFVLSAGGMGDEPLPLLCTPHPRLDRPRDLLASFMGQFSPGGPDEPAGSMRCSSSNPNGAGTRIRHKMREVFGGVVDCELLPWAEDIEKYREQAARSRFGLCPRGYGKTSFRLYEMFSMGTVPVYIYDDAWLPYKDKLERHPTNLHWTDFCVFSHESELSTLPTFLAAIGDDWWNEARGLADALFDDYFTMDGCCRQIARMVEERWG